MWNIFNERLNKTKCCLQLYIDLQAQVKVINRPSHAMYI